MWLFPNGYIGASPDGIVRAQPHCDDLKAKSGYLDKCPVHSGTKTHCTKYGCESRKIQIYYQANGVLEVKCPFALRDVHFFNDTRFIQYMKSASVKKHKFQVLAQLYATGLQWGDLITWCPAGLHSNIC